MRKYSLMLMLLLIFGLSSCHLGDLGNMPGGEKGDVSDLGDDDSSFGNDLDDSGIFDGYFENQESDITVECVFGTNGAYSFENNILTFTALSENSIYKVSGKLAGSIVIDVTDDYEFELELWGLSLVSTTNNPIMILSGDKVTITAKKDYVNYIYDKRETVSDDDETLYKAAIYSFVDLEVSGKGILNVVSYNNNGIHTKDDLKIKNLNLNVVCLDNALKGNDSVEIKDGTLILIASSGDCIKTENSDISIKGNQRGDVTIEGGKHTLYAACDGIDASHDVVINNEETELNIYTDKYSNYSNIVTSNVGGNYFIRYFSNQYTYSIKYYNFDDDYLWVNATYHSVRVAGGGRPGSQSYYYYYSFPKKQEYSKLQFFIYSSGQAQGQDEEYVACSELIAPSTSYDTIGIAGSGYSWTNYATMPQAGFGGMNEGNSDKGDHSTKGIKSANEIIINNGTINIKAYDDAIHANNDGTLENGENPLGNITINGGNITVYSNDDGIHADNILTINEGTVSVVNSYEGLEGFIVHINNGYISIYSKDDGINSTATSGEGIVINGGVNYIYACGDGIDSNSRTSFSGIVFAGGKTVVISNSNGNSAIDTERGYKYEGGYVVAVMPSGGMTEESTNASNFSSVATKKTASLSADNCIEVSGIVTFKSKISGSSFIVFLGSNSASISTSTSDVSSLDSNGVWWK